ncbi:TylF/MycF/NovP-related O-methyltransferase, partial [Acinetobacter baumannii]
YIDLLKRSLTNMIYLDAEIPNITDEEYAALLDRRTTGSDTPRPPFALTLIGWKRMTNVQELVERVLKEGVPGDMFEAGVWRGGAAILMRG